MRGISRVVMVITCLLTSSCGITVHVDPIDVRVSFSMEEIKEAFEVACKRDLGETATKAQVDACTQLKLATLIMDIQNVLAAK